MFSTRACCSSVAALLLLMCAVPSFAQSFRVQCPFTTPSHPTALPAGGAEPAYIGPSFTGPNSTPTGIVNGAIKCQQISGGDGYATMADGTQTYLFAFGPLSGIADIQAGRAGTEFAAVFNTVGDPRTDATYNGAVGLVPDPESSPPGQLTGHVDPRPIMDIGVMNGNMPAPEMAIDEDDEFFLTLTNVGMIMRPDLFEQHTVHFHGYPNASSFYDGVPDASVAINIGGSFTYYYLAPDAGTYFWHCHITPPEHLQMGMVGQIFVRPRQNRVPSGKSLYAALVAQQDDLRTRCGNDILCSTPLPPSNGVLHVNDKSGKPTLYAYNDGDGSTAYDVEYPVQIHGFDPNFHFVGMTFNPEPFTDMKDKYFMLNGRSYPDTVTQGPMQTPVADGTAHVSQPLPTIINIPAGGRALLRISDLDVTEFQTLASLGVRMHVIGVNARLLRDMAGNDMTYYTNSITLGGGESIDVILDASDTTTYAPGSVYYLYTPNLDHLSNDAENFGGLMTEVRICPAALDPATKSCI
ncbi:multicopper oxidase family protein [Burkholderia sp. Bp9090]|uniref:multicopper oxidase domain-containing protein n=1 Tax=Burkholderia sp. Bp9090 TaxID=2184567 RepID=UPI000F5E5326|nr:multicopper oxidase family protein [Burkholderia sp. Bp9090]RQZ38584.1 multicopper oxidase family protein [Burkholderia sp. Bp9090]